MTVPDLANLEQQHDLNFKDKQLLQRAFVHRSYLNEAEHDGTLADNERLEFLGDTVLGFVVSEELFRRFPLYQEGALTNLRAALVRRETLARLAKQLHLGDYLLLGHGEEDSGGRYRVATLCATFEALIGALYIDQGIDVVRQFTMSLVGKELDRVQKNALEKDPKSRLQEWVQSNLGQTPRYKMVESHGPDHNKTFVMQVVISHKIYGVASGHSKQEATQAAAAMSLQHLGENAPEYIPDPELEAKYGLIPPINGTGEAANGQA
ncbi:MAG: ribonuclease III [Chloroflexi bacterium]|nr:ribonuclease III [Chloroflexota bacterium]